MLGHVYNLQSIEIPQNGKFIGGNTMLIHFVDQVKAAWFESDFCTSCASYIATILLIDLFLPTKFHYIFTNVMAHLHCTLYQFMHSLKTETKTLLLLTPSTV